MQFYGGTKQAVTAADRRARDEPAVERAAIQPQRREDAVGRLSSSNLAILRVDYAFSPRATVRSLTQYNSLTHEVTNNVRFNFIYRPGSDIYIVYNDLQQTGLPQAVFAPAIASSS